MTILTPAHRTQPSDQQALHKAERQWSVQQCAQWLDRLRAPWSRTMVRLGLVATVASLLVACGTSPSPKAVVYDFGPGALAAVSASAGLPSIVLHEVEAGASLDGNALLYRLGYADAQALRPYAQARWSMPPAQLMRQRLREVLGQSRHVLAPQDAPPLSQPGLRVDLEEFSHWFDSPQSSNALVRVRATLVQTGKPAQQTTFVLRQNAASPDAAGGARALAQAADAVAVQLDQWLRQTIATAP